MPTANFSTAISLPHTNCTEEDFYELCRTLVPLNGSLVDGDSLQVSSGQIVAGNRTPYFRKLTKTFSDLAQASATFDIELFLLPPGGVIHAIKLKHTVAFTGGALSAYTLSIGNSGTLSKYMAAQNVFNAPSATNHHIVWAPFFNSVLPPTFVNTDNAIGALTIGASYNQTEVQNLRNACETLADDCRALRTALVNLCGAQVGSESDTGNQSIRLAAAATGGNTSLATAGSVDIWVLYSILQ
jgi:hypothetical protein